MRNLKTFFLGLALIMLFSLSMASAATDTPEFKAKKGDKNTYKYDKYTYNGKSEYTTSQEWDDGTTSNVTVKAGTTYTVEVCSVTTTNVSTKVTYNGKSTTCEDTTDSGEVMAVYDNTSYYQALVDQNSTMFQLSGDVFTTVTDIPGFLSYPATHVEMSINTKTGWVTKLYEKEVADNGTVISEIQISQGSAGGVPGFDFTTVVTFFAVAVPVVMIYKKRRQ